MTCKLCMVAIAGVALALPHRNIVLTLVMATPVSSGWSATILAKFSKEYMDAIAEDATASEKRLLPRHRIPHLNLPLNLTVILRPTLHPAIAPQSSRPITTHFPQMYTPKAFQRRWLPNQIL
mmetsp:Transcript_42704/g.81674  ORF Transcript_42704/g.81674 Transcript_42704/m.81674 type:complete len:122 (+) Transcript_42704:559-924(+)